VLRPVHMHKKLFWNSDPLLRGPVGPPG
jgi:hypothetical protein